MESLWHGKASKDSPFQGSFEGKSVAHAARFSLQNLVHLWKALDMAKLLAFKFLLGVLPRGSSPLTRDSISTLMIFTNNLLRRLW